MRLTPCKDRRRGLSLLEVIVSLLIFLMSIGALTHLLTSASHLAVESRTRTQAALYAHSKLNEVRIGAIGLSAQQETQLEDDEDYNWSMEVAQGAYEGLHNVTVSVSRKAPTGNDIKVSLTQIILDPQFQGSSLDGSGTNSMTEAESSGSSSSTTPSTTPAGGTGGAASGSKSGGTGGTGGVMSGGSGGTGAGRIGGGSMGGKP